MQKLVRDNRLKPFRIIFQTEINQHDRNAVFGNQTRTKHKIFMRDKFRVNVLARFCFDFFDNGANFRAQIDAQKFTGLSKQIDARKQEKKNYCESFKYHRCPKLPPYSLGGGVFWK